MTQQKVAVITGGSRGIGAATAEALAAEGWDIAISYRQDEHAAAAVVDACARHERQAIAIRADVGDPAALDNLFEATTAELGPLTAVINNAGIVPPAGRVATFDADRLRHLLTVNVTGAFLVAGQAVRRMSTENGGAGGVIVNVSSRAAVLGSAGEYVDYAASKAAVDALTVGLATEVAGEGIRVVGVRPGLIDTEIHAPGRLDRLGSTPPLGRPGSAAEVSAAIVYLVSDGASYVTGTSIDVSGGR